MDFPPNPAQPLRIQTLAPPLLTIMALAILQPLVVITTTVLPAQIGEATWRVRVFALLLGTTPQVAVSLVVIAAIGLFSERYAAVRWASIAALVIGILLIPLLVLDGLDVLQVRTLVPADQVHGYYVNALQTAAMAGVLVPILLWMGRRGLQAGKQPVATEVDDHLVVGKAPPPV
jgi:hypothetical protein